MLEFLSMKFMIELNGFTLHPKEGLYSVKSGYHKWHERTYCRIIMFNLQDDGNCGI